MRNIFAFAAFALGVACGAGPAAAGNKTYLSPTGSDANDCFSEATACKGFQKALSQAGANGEILCLGEGFYGFNAPVTFSITIACQTATWQFGGNPLQINTVATDIVIIDGLNIDARKQGSSPLVEFFGAGALILRNTRLQNNGNWHGVHFRPNGAATLQIVDSHIVGNAGTGVYVQPQAGGYANVHMRNVNIQNNGFGLVADGQLSTIGINVNISDSMVSGNGGNGLYAFTIPGKAAVNVTATQISGNLGIGVRAEGPGATTRIGASLVAGNGTGLSTASGGQILTHGNNQLSGNGVKGAFTGNLGLE